MNAENPVLKMLAKPFPHEMSEELKNVLTAIFRSLSPNSLSLQASEYIHVLKNGNWNYRQVSAALNNFWNLSAEFVEKHVCLRNAYETLANEVVRVVELWNRDMRPAQQQLERMNKIANPGPGLRTVKA